MAAPSSTTEQDTYLTQAYLNGISAAKQCLEHIDEQLKLNEWKDENFTWKKSWLQWSIH